jgi:DNA-binding response OmpR family regulator
MDQVIVLQNGADDYITKPFYPEVVLAKIESNLRRAYGSYALTKPGLYFSLCLYGCCYSFDAVLEAPV